MTNKASTGVNELIQKLDDARKSNLLDTEEKKNAKHVESQWTLWEQRNRKPTQDIYNGGIALGSSSRSKVKVIIRIIKWLESHKRTIVETL